MSKSKAVEMSLKDITEAIEEAGYEGFMMYIDPETKKLTFSANGKGLRLAGCLYDVFKKAPDFFELVSSSVYAYAITDKEAFEALDKLREMAKIVSKL